MSVHFRLFAILLLSFAAPFPPALSTIASAQTAHIELHSLETLTLTDRQFLLGDKTGKPARIGAELRLPPGTTKVPAVVLIHGSSGVGANVDLWAREFNEMGVAALIVDSFTGRGITQTVSDQSQLSSFSMILDAYTALELLSKHPRIQPDRVALLGVSKGGFVAMYASMRRFQRLWGPQGLEFAAYFPFYARCDTPLLEDENISDHPIRLFHGSADDYVPVGPTRQYVDRLKRAAKDVQLTVYEGARHSFDNPLNASLVLLPQAIVPNNCHREEKQPGDILNLDTGKTFAWSDACVTRGADIGYSPQAREEASKAVKSLLRSLWNLN